MSASWTPRTSQSPDAPRFRSTCTSIRSGLIETSIPPGGPSLSKLATFPVDRLKIDRSFLGDIEHEEDDAPLVAAMIALAHRLGLAVTAEGVETPGQLAYLRRNGCDLLQGYLFSPPVPPDRFEELLRGQQASGPGRQLAPAGGERRRSRLRSRESLRP